MTTTGSQSVVLLDTDVFSFIYKNRQEAALYLRHLKNAVPALSFVTVAELYQWAFQRHWAARNI